MTNIVQFSGTLLFTGIIYKLGPMDKEEAYIIPLACQWIVPAIIITTVWFWPESPVWLARMGRRDEAINSLRRIHGTSRSIDRDALLAVIEQGVAQERAHADSDSATYAECFDKTNRSRTLICIFIYGGQYLSGLIFVLGYQSYITSSPASTPPSPSS